MSSLTFSEVLTFVLCFVKACTLLRQMYKIHMQLGVCKGIGLHASSLSIYMAHTGVQACVRSENGSQTLWKLHLLSMTTVRYTPSCCMLTSEQYGICCMLTWTLAARVHVLSGTADDESHLLITWRAACPCRRSWQKWASLPPGGPAGSACW